MNTRISSITIPVTDIQKSVSFYRDGLGFRAEKKDDKILLHLPNRLLIILISRDNFWDYTKRLNRDNAIPGTASFILTYFAADIHEVDTIMSKAIKAGAKQPAAPSVEASGYAGYLLDPDGYIWEIVYSKEYATANGNKEGTK